MEGLRTVSELIPDLAKISEFERKPNLMDCFVFALEAEEEGNPVQIRMTALDEGATEDQATGSGTGVSGAHLMNSGKLPPTILRAIQLKRGMRSNERVASSKSLKTSKCQPRHTPEAGP